MDACRSSRRVLLLAAAAAAMIAKVGGVFGTLRDPHLIQPYLAYYDHLASHYGGPWCSPIPWWCTKKHLQVSDPPIYG